MSLLVNLIKDIFYFPIWWYGKGLKKRWLFVLKKIKTAYKNLALKILLVNLFRPMYGEKDWQGRIISFFARLIMLFWRSLEMIIWSLLFFALLLIWLIAPILIIRQILILLL